VLQAFLFIRPKLGRYDPLEWSLKTGTEQSAAAIGGGRFCAPAPGPAIVHNGEPVPQRLHRRVAVFLVAPYFARLTQRRHHVWIGIQPLESSDRTGSVTLAPLAAFDDTALARSTMLFSSDIATVAYYRGLQDGRFSSAKCGTPLSERCSISEVSLFHAGRHLRHGHQWLPHLIKQLASILLFSQRGREELDQERLANLKR
jgi:hypothetical protein